MNEQFFETVEIPFKLRGGSQQKCSVNFNTTNYGPKSRTVIRESIRTTIVMNLGMRGIVSIIVVMNSKDTTILLITRAIIKICQWMN